MLEDASVQRILVVEDEPEVRMLVERMLKKMGYSVTSATNGEDALSLINGGDLFDLLFTDIVMPGGINEVNSTFIRGSTFFTSSASCCP